MGRLGRGLVIAAPQQRHLDILLGMIAPLGPVLVAYSGGVDSALVLEAAHRALGSDCTGVIAQSPSLPRAELEAALEIARERGIDVTVLETHEVERADYARNGPDRCYFCKTELYQELGRFAVGIGARAVLDGFNADDRADWRPGRKAGVEHGVVSPLDRAGMNKADVRLLARALGLRNWDKPEAACLSSRIPYGVPVTIEALARVESAESALRSEGFRQVRVRDRDAGATIEVEQDQVARLLEPARLERVRRQLHALGYSSVAVDERGYVRGSLNRDLGRPARDA